MDKVKKKEALSLEEKLEQALVPVDEQPYEVPENWCWVKFGILSADMADGPFGSNLKTEHYTDNKEVRIIQLSNIGEEGWREENTKYTTFEHVKTISRSIVEPGNIVIAKMMPAGRAIICPDVEKMYVLSSDAVKMVPHAQVDVKYLVYCINSPMFRNQVQENTQGITRARTSIKKLKEYAFPLPPLTEQQRIVAQIESLFAKLDEAKEKSLLVLEAFDINRSAILYAAFSGELSKKWRKGNNVSKDTWKEMVIGDIGEVVTGSTPSTKNPEYFEGNIPFIKPTELNQGKNVFTSAEYLTEAGRDVSRSVKKGSTCVCCIGATIGKCGMLQVDAVTNQQINTIIPYDFMHDEYVYFYCSSDKFRNVLIENASATTLPIINKSRMSQLPIMVPLIEEQKFIVKELNTLLQKQEVAKWLAEDVVSKIDLMKKTILAKAFRGELGTNNPDEESAVELLKSILM